MYITKEGKEWFVEAEKLIREQTKKRKPLTVECEIWITIYTSTKRDADASTKPIMDVFQKAEVIENDYLFNPVHAVREKCKKNEDRIEIEIMGY